jgi:hypothetical protein
MSMFLHGEVLFLLSEQTKRALPTRRALSGDDPPGKD